MCRFSSGFFFAAPVFTNLKSFFMTVWRLFMQSGLDRRFAVDLLQEVEKSL